MHPDGVFHTPYSSNSTLSRFPLSVFRGAMGHIACREGAIMAPHFRPVRWVSLLLVVFTAIALPAFGDDDPKKERTDRYGDPLPAGAVARFGTVRFRARDVWCITYSPDGKAVATGSSDLTARLWDVSTGRELRRFTGHERVINSLVFSHDGKRLGTTDIDGSLRVWDRTTGEEQWRKQGPRDGYYSIPSRLVVFSADDKMLAGSLPRSTAVVLWDAATGQEIRRLEGHANPVGSITFTPDSRNLVSAAAEETIRVWDVASGRQQKQLIGASPAALSPDGKLLASSGPKLDGIVYLQDFDTGKQLQQFNAHTTNLRDLAFSPDSKQLVCAGGDYAAYLWDLTTGRELQRFREPGFAVSGVGIDWSPNGKTLALAGWDGIPRFYDSTNGKERLDFGGHRAAVLSMALSPDGKTIATSSEDFTVRLWDAATGKELRILVSQTDVECYCFSLAWSPDGKSLALAAGESGLFHYDLATGRVLAKFRSKGHWPCLVAFSPSGKLLASRDQRSFVTLWDTATGKELRRLDLNRSAAGLAFSADGRVLATGNENPHVRLWDPETGVELRPITRWDPNFATGGALTYSPDGRTLASSSPDSGASVNDTSTVILYEVATGKERWRLTQQHSKRSPVAFSPDGRFLVVGGTDKLVRLISLATGKEIRQFPGHEDSILCLTFARDGKRIFSASSDTTLLAWDVEELVKEAQVTRRLSANEAYELGRELLSADAARAYWALWRLIEAPEDCVALLKDILQEDRRPSKQRVAQLIGDLDDDKFEVRDKATRELEAVGDEAEGALRKALAGNPSPEVRQRAKALLDRIEAGAVPLPRLRAVRGVEVLELLRTPGASALLTKLATGAPDALLTREAKAALERLAPH
jgi:WD40 repeat protein